MKVCQILKGIRDRKFYTTAEKIWLNDIRMKFLIYKEKEGI
jgi:hypothetical protein